MTILDRAREIAAFLGIPEAQAIERLNKGFAYQHAQVTADWKRVNPQTDEQILEWYRTTESYIWELSAYHADPGFNYDGMCRGIAERLRTAGANSVLCLGDGIGDLTLTLRRAGIHEPIYHDLNGSKTAEFARFRFKRAGFDMSFQLSCGFEPGLVAKNYDGDFAEDLNDAIVSLDFLEHVTDVEAWARAIHAALKPGGLFAAQNAFALGSGPNGSMPMHLARNDRFEKEWDPLLERLGFRQLSSNWYERPA